MNFFLNFQVHSGIQLNQQNMHDSRNTVSMTSQGHCGSPSNLNQMGVAATSTSLGHHGASGGAPNMSQLGANAPPGLNHMNSTNMSPLSQTGGANSTTVNPSQNPNASMNAHPRSPATLNQMHPCSPAAAGAGAQQRPLSNPSLGLTASSQTPSASGSCSPLLVCSSSSGIMPTPSQGRQSVVGGNLPSGRTSIQNTIPQVMSGLGQSVGPLQQGHNIGQGGSNTITNSSGVMIGQGATTGTVASSQRPESRGGNGVKTSGETQTPNPPSSSSASTDFDLMFNEGEFAALLS